MSTAILILALVPGANDDVPEWAGFRGNNGTGVSEAKELPAKLAEENLSWRTEVPKGYSSPVVAGTRVFLTGVDDKKLVTMCLDRSSGEVRWRSEEDFDGLRPGLGSVAAPSPTTDGERLYVVFHNLGLLCFDLDGEQLWRHPLGPFNIPHGMASSPILHEDLVILQVDQDLGAYLVAVDKRTGDLRWKADRPGVMHGYSTPALYVPDEGPAEIIVSNSFQICGHSVRDGKKLWWVNGAAYMAKTVPVVVGDRCFVSAYQAPSTELGMPKFTQSWKELLADKDSDGNGVISKSEWPHEAMLQAWFVFDFDDDGEIDEKEWDFMVSTGRETGGLFAIRLGGRGDVTESHIDWKYDGRRGLPDMPSPLFLGGALFVIKQGGLLTSFDPASGEILKQGRVGQPDNYGASLIGADGKIYLASCSGLLCVISAAGEWEILSEESVDEPVWSTPAIAGKQVLVRSEGAVYSFEAVH